MRNIALLLLLLTLPATCLAQTRTIHFDLRTGQTVAENFLPADTGYIYIERGNHAVLQLAPRDYYYQSYPLYNYRGCPRSSRPIGAR